MAKENPRPISKGLMKKLIDGVYVLNTEDVDGDLYRMTREQAVELWLGRIKKRGDVIMGSYEIESMLKQLVPDHMIGTLWSGQSCHDIVITRESYDKTVMQKFLKRVVDKFIDV